MELWKEYKLGEFMQFNPKERIAKGHVARKIAMDQLVPFCRDVSSNIYEVYKGGAKFRNGDTIMARITPCLENGKTSYISSLKSNEVAFGSTEYIVLRNIQDVSDSRFIYYLSICPQIREVAIKSMVGSSGRQRVQQDVLENYCMNLPSLPTQQKIANILSSLDDKIEVNRRVNEQLEELAQALFKSWFVDFEPFKGGEFVESELGMIPEGWKVGTLGDITTELKNKVGNRTDVKVLSPINTGELVLSEEFFTKQVFSKSIAKYLIVKPYDFAYNPARVNIGSLGMNEFNFDGCVSPVYVVFRCNKGYDYFFDLYRKRQSFKDEVLSRSIGGVRQTLSYKDFAMISLVYPPINIVNAFNETYTKIKNIILHNQQEITYLTNLRDTLLPKLMSGEIDVNEVEI